ncbi:MAG: tyramine oxidase [Burkholderiales bacterium RIFCSPLOWO2_12_67_14]|nr:MAG: tyramine oxidase [Burkholderiales bacterium RIFCSPLOWO2_02_FULL_67_64]OGB38836.1 MAG: tyramine oxidase [Burkholderiales bacterium RIFCSPLOWO2_12_67_14]OGB79148.1 MAG: tyramine oxidase [Burkholderiales bacterium RIFCSPLOWO2_12_FULL_67_210]
MPTRSLPLALSAVALAAAALWSPLALAHGAAAKMVPLKKAAKDFNATVHWDSYARVFTLSRNSTLVRVKPGAKTAQVNGAPLRLGVPVVMRKGRAYVAADFFQQVFQSGLDKTFVVERKPNPLNPLTAAEIQATLEVLKASGQFKPGHRFTEIVLKAPPKDQVWAHALEGTPVQAPRQAAFVILDGRKLIEGTVDLASKKLLQWQPVEGAHGMVLIDDFGAVQAAIEASPEYAQALALRGINDVKKVVATPLTVGHFDGKDGLKQEARLLKVVSYLDVGDNNYWAHPIENLVAVVDLEKKQVIKIEDAGVIPVPMKATPYDGSAGKGSAPRKPLNITEPEGKNYTISGNTLTWRNWDFHIGLNSRTGLTLSTVTYNDKGSKRKVMYEGTLGGMIVPHGDPDVGWYFKAYLDSGEYGMGTLTSPIEAGKDAPQNAVYLDATIADFTGAPMTIPNAIAVFERYAGPEYKHQEMGKPNVSTERRELVVRWISTVGNYDYMFDWVFAENGTIGINAGATGIEAVKGVKARTMQDATAAADTKYGTLIDHNIVGTTHQHIYNFRLDLDVDGEANTLTEMDPVVLPNTAGGPRTSTMQTTQRTVATEKQAAQKFDPATIRLLSHGSKTNKVGNPVSYQLIPYAGGTHPVAKGANFGQDEWIYNRLNFMDKQIWVTRYHTDERFPEGRFPNRSNKDTGLGQFSADDQAIVNTDNVVWLTTGTTHVARAEEWPIMPTEWVNVLLKPWNFFSETPTLGLVQPAKPAK